MMARFKLLLCVGDWDFGAAPFDRPELGLGCNFKCSETCDLRVTTEEVHKSLMFLRNGGTICTVSGAHWLVEDDSKHHPSELTYGVSQIRDTILGVPVIRTIVYYSILGSILGSPYLGKLPYVEALPITRQI